MHDVLKSRNSVQVSPALPRILFAVFQTGRLANGGVESITAIITGLREFDRLVVTNRETPFCNRWRAAGARVVVRDLPWEASWSQRSGDVLSLVRRLVSLAATNLQVLWWALCGQVSVVHCNDPAPFWHVAPAAWLARLPVILNLRDTKSAEEGLDVGKYRRRFRLASRILVLSKEMRNFYAPAARQLPQISHIYSAVDFERMSPVTGTERAALRARLGISRNTFAVGYIATFNDKKNQSGFLKQAAALLSEVCPTAKTYFVGDFEPNNDSYSRACGEAVEAAKLQDVTRFVGFSPRVEDWYRACDLVIVPTRKEGLARCMIEALACGTPVVSFDVSSAKEILTEHACGEVVAQGNYPALCATIARLAQSPQILAVYSANGVATAQRLFSEDNCLTEYRRLALAVHHRRPVSPR